MSVYMTEEEQIESIKQWWRRYSFAITLVLSVLLLAFSGWRYWNWHLEKVQSEASNTYEHMMLSFSNHKNKDTRAYANQLINEYEKTVYADAAHMILARLYISHDDVVKARIELEAVVDHSAMPALKQISRIRIARLLTAEKSYNKALEELKVVNDVVYMPLVNELKGDIYAATGQFQQAILSYKEAITEVRTHGMGNMYLEMKTNELAALTQAINLNRTARQAA